MDTNILSQNSLFRRTIYLRGLMFEQRKSQEDDAYHESENFDYELDNNESLIQQGNKIYYYFGNDQIAEFNMFTLFLLKFNLYSEYNLFTFTFNEDEKIKSIVGIFNKENYKLYLQGKESDDFEYYKFKFYDDGNIEDLKYQTKYNKVFTIGGSQYFNLINGNTIKQKDNYKFNLLNSFIQNIPLN